MFHASFREENDQNAPPTNGVKWRPAVTDAHVGIAQPCRYCFTQWSKNGVFALQGRHVAPINVKFGTEECSEGSLPHAKFHVYRGRNVGKQPPKLSKFLILAIKLPLMGHSFAQFLRNSQILYASPGGF